MFNQIAILGEGDILVDNNQPGEGIFIQNISGAIVKRWPANSKLMQFKNSKWIIVVDRESLELYKKYSSRKISIPGIDVEILALQIDNYVAYRCEGKIYIVDISNS